jgi:twitching motility protein PilT
MLTREQVDSFRMAGWSSHHEVEAFVAGITGFGRPDVTRLLEILSDKTADLSPQKQRLRLAAFGRLAQGVRDRSLFSSYVKALKGSDRSVRAALVALIPLVNDGTRHQELCELLHSPDEDLRGAAARALKSVGSRKSVETLETMLAEPEFPGRRQAIELLVALAGHRAIPGLGIALRAGKPMEKRLCLRYLGDPQLVGKDVAAACEALLPALDESSEVVLQEAIGAWCRICTEDGYFERIPPFLDFESPAVVRAAVLGLQRFGSPRAIMTLERKLRAGPNAVRMAVLETLEAMRSDDILPPLVQALSHRQLAVRSRASEILARLSKGGQLNLHRTIIWLLRANDADLRRTAADLAREVPDPDAELWPKLLEFLRDDDWWVRERVVDALLEMAGARMSPLIARYLKDPSDVIRRFAIEVFLRLKDAKTLGLLVRTAAEDQDWWVRERAVEAVAALEDPRAVPYLVNLLATREDMALACLRALADLEAREAADAVLAQLDSPLPDVRLEAIHCLRVFDESRNAAALQRLNDDASDSVRTAAQDLLHRWQMSIHQRVEDVGAALSSLDGMLVACAEAQGDDLILAAGRRPFIKRLGRVTPLLENELSPDHVEALISAQLSTDQREAVRAGRDADFSYVVRGQDLRFRVNVFRQFSGYAAVFRIIKSEIPKLEDLGLPPVVASLSEYRNGLVLVGGPTGSGKSTTLAALIDSINRNSSRHVMSMEDPIEMLHKSRRGLVNQREIGTHTRSSTSALRSTLRQDPDVILVGEMRDLPTISFAVTAAETGHLVFGTLHTVSADTTVDRIINAFPHAQASQVRSMLSDSLRAVICQYLITRRSGRGRCLAVEVLLNSDAVANMIRKGKTHQIPSIITTSREMGMRSMDGELRRLYDDGVISAEDAFMRAASKKEFEDLLEGGALPLASQAPGVEEDETASPAAPAAPATVPAAGKA